MYRGVAFNPAFSLQQQAQLRPGGVVFNPALQRPIQPFGRGQILNRGRGQPFVRGGAQFFRGVPQFTRGAFAGRGIQQLNTAVPRQIQQVDFNKFTTEQIKQHLAQRNLPTMGDRAALLTRLKGEINQAWANYPLLKRNVNALRNRGRGRGGMRGRGGFRGQYNVSQFNANAQIVGKKKRKRKRKRSTLTEEERADRERERNAAKEAKAARKAENKKKAEEAQRKKRQRREEAAARQREMERKQKEMKEQRQRSEVFVFFDMKAFSEQLMLSIDPNKDRVTACNYDFSQKGFRVRFTKEEFAAGYAEGSTMFEPRTLSVPTKLQVLPGPVESRCLFFLDPCHSGHPEKEKSFEWVREQGVESKTSDVKTLKLWRQIAIEHFKQHGTITNIFRERGFIVVQYQDGADATKALKALQEVEGEPKLNDITLIFLKQGTPKKRDRLECDKKYPKPGHEHKHQGKKRKKDEVEKENAETKKEGVGETQEGPKKKKRKRRKKKKATDDVVKVEGGDVAPDEVEDGEIVEEGEIVEPGSATTKPATPPTPKVKEEK